MIHTHAVPSFLPCSLRVFDACHGFCREIALFLALPRPPFLRINVKLHSPLSLFLLILRHPLILLVIGTSEKNIRFEQFVLLSVGKIVIYPESLYPTVYYTYIYIYVEKTNSVYKYLSQRFSQAQAYRDILNVICPWTSGPHPFLRMCKTVPFYYKYPRARVVHFPARKGRSPAWPWCGACWRATAGGK